MLEKEKHAYLKLKYLNLLLNMASVSQKDIESILNKHGIANIGIVDYAADPIEITYEEGEFLKLEMSADYVSWG